MKLFDNDKVEALYNRLLNGESVIHQIHQESTPLIEHLASKVCQPKADDLIQEGHIKLYYILTERKYNPKANAKLYSFLYSSLRNAMIDYLRSEIRRECDPLEDWEESNQPKVLEPELEATDVLTYMDLRYPTIPSSIKLDASKYILENWLERQRQSSRAAIKTIEIYYLNNRRQAYMFYNSQLIYLRAKLTDVELREAKALSLANNGHEFSLLPEVYLISNEAPTITKLLEGLYVKF